MANTLTNLSPTIYEALDSVSRELVGFIPAVWRNPDGRNLDRAALNQTIRFPQTQAATAADNTPGQTAPNTGDQTVDSQTLTISKSRHVPIRWNGEEQKLLRTGDSPRLNGILQDQFAQAFRTLTNEIETDIASTYTAASRAYGTAGTTPFAASTADAAQIKKILDDNGAPMTDRQMIIDTTAGVNLRSLTNLTQVSAAGTDATLRRGELLDLHGFAIRESAQVASHTAGTATGFDANGGEPAGETTIVVDGSDSGTILAGDVVTWVGDTNKYIVQSATASGAATGNIVIAKPGLQATLADTVEGTLGSAYTANMAFQRNAVVLITRLPALPEGGDMAVETMVVTDPISGIAFEIAMYREYLQVHMQIRAAWGYSIVKPEHCAILLG
jgi:hypothetical protein